MQLSADTRAGANVIIGYSAGELRLRDRIVTTSAIVTARAVVPWPVERVEDLTPALLAPAFEVAEVVLLATGSRQRWPAAEIVAAAAARRVGLEVMDLGAACRTYNLLVADERPVALAAILDRVAGPNSAGR